MEAQLAWTRDYMRPALECSPFLSPQTPRLRVDPSKTKKVSISISYLFPQCHRMNPFGGTVLRVSSSTHLQGSSGGARLGWFTSNRGYCAHEQTTVQHPEVDPLVKPPSRCTPCDTQERPAISPEAECDLKRPVSDLKLLVDLGVVRRTTTLLSILA